MEVGDDTCEMKISFCSSSPRWTVVIYWAVKTVETSDWHSACHWPDLCLWWSWEQLAAEMKVGSLLLIRQCTCFYYMGWTMYFTLLQQLTNNFISCSFWPLNNKFYLLLMQPTSMVAANLFLCHMSNLVGLTSCSIKKIFVMIFPFPQLV